MGLIQKAAFKDPQLNREWAAMAATVNPTLIAIQSRPVWNVLGQGTNPKLINNWVNFNNTFRQASFSKDALGYVHLAGLVAGGTVGFAFANAIFFLPVGYRPAFPVIASTASNDLFGEIRIGNYTPNAGCYEVVATVGNSAWVSLDNISFLAEQ